MDRFASVALAVLTGLVVSHASAQDSVPIDSDFDASGSEDTRARDAFDAGRTALDEGHPEDALADFQEAYRLSGRPELLYNIGFVQERLHHDRPALEAYEGYLEAVPDAANRANVEDRITRLRDDIARDDALSAALARSDARDGGDDLVSSPVLWVIVGVVVVGAAVGIGLGVGLSQDPGTAPPVAGPSGVVISALSF